MPWSKSLTDKTLEMIKSMDAYGASFKSLSGEYGKLMPVDNGYEIILYKESKGFEYPPALGNKKYHFTNAKEIIDAGWAID